MSWKSWTLGAKLGLAVTLLVVLAVLSLTVLAARYAGQVLLAESYATVRNLGLAVALVTSAIGIVVALWLSRSVTRPLRDLTEAVEEIARGNFSRKIPIDRRGDELSALCAALNDMVASLQQIAEHRGAIIDAVYEGIMIVDHRGQILELNPAAAKMFGYRRTEASKVGLGDLITVRGSVGQSRKQIGQYLRGGNGSLFGQMIEAQARRADDREFPIEWAITRISATQPPMFTIVVHDLTDRKLAEEELREAKEAAESASRAKSTFLANMSHELRTPLSAIIGYSELLQEEVVERGYEDLVPDLEKVQTAGRHLLALINGILDMSKIEAGRMELHLETFALADLIEDVVTTSRPLAMKQGDTLEVSYPEDIGEMHADRTKTQQILLNLLNNAAKFTEQGTITFTAARETVGGIEWIRFRIADTGIGMRQEHVASLFQPFTQVDSAAARLHAGAGLGLAISESFCRLMGGEISVESEAGRGSAFTLRLPAVVQAGPSKPESPADR